MNSVVAPDSPSHRGAFNKRAIAFASVNMPIAGLAIPLAAFLPAHYTNYVGIDVATVGLAFFLVQVIQAAMDPLVGMMVDATRTRLGQARPWLILGTLITLLGTFATFQAPRGAGPGYLIVSLLVLYLGISISTIAQNTWAGHMARGNKERVEIFGWLHAYGQIGTLFVLSSAVMFGYFYSSADIGLVAVMGAIFVLLIPVTALIAISCTKEPKHEGKMLVAEKVRLSDPIKLLKSGSVTRILLSCFFIALASSTGASVMIFFWNTTSEYSLVDITIFSTIYFVGSVISVPLWSAVVLRTDKRRGLICSSLAYTFLNPFIFGLGGMHFAAAAFGMFVLGLAIGATQFMARAMMADANDEYHLRHGVDRLGQMSSLIGVAEKIATALGIVAAYSVLGYVGFEGGLGNANTSSAIWWVEQLTLFAPAGIAACSALALVGYRLNASRHKGILDEMGRCESKNKGAVRELICDDVQGV